MEIKFSVAETFIGGSVAGLPGVLLKDEELVQGQPLIGASARVVGNTFLYALSAASGDVALGTASDQVEENGRFVIRGNVLGGDSTAVVQSFGGSSATFGQVQAGGSLDMDYVWTSTTRFTHTEAPRLYYFAALKANIELVTSRKWIDFAMIYATGRRAILTLEKDDAAMAMFNEVFEEWGRVASAD
jgi:hypothetical protein